jgi:hypothetical protein
MLIPEGVSLVTGASVCMGLPAPHYPPYQPLPGPLLPPIGRAIALRLVSDGYEVASEEFASRRRWPRALAHYVLADVSSENQVHTRATAMPSDVVRCHIFFKFTRPIGGFRLEL